MASTAMVSGDYSNERMIECLGSYESAGIKWNYSGGTSTLLFPFGVSGKYMPASYTIHSASASGSISVVPINTKHPATQLLAESKQNSYWKVRSSCLGTYSVSHQCQYSTADVQKFTDGTFTGRRFYIYTWAPQGGIVNSIDTVN